MDGTTAGNGPGPRTMYPVVKNVMLASADQVAIDAVSAKMMGFDPMSLDYIRLAHEDGLGVGDPRDIEIVGDVDAAQENWNFHVGKNLVRVGGGDLIWFGPLKRFQKLFFHTPLVNGFILASDVYHDFYRWPLVDRRVFERWCETTEWGQMFLRYAQMGPQGASRSSQLAVDARHRPFPILRLAHSLELRAGVSVARETSRRRLREECAMNYGRLALAAVAATVVDGVYGFVVYGNAARRRVREVPGRLPLERDADAVPAADVRRHLSSRCSSRRYIYAKGYEGGSGVQEGVRFGVLLGAVHRRLRRRRQLRDAEHRPTARRRCTLVAGFVEWSSSAS